MLIQVFEGCCREWAPLVNIIARSFLSFSLSTSYLRAGKPKAAFSQLWDLFHQEPGWHFSATQLQNKSITQYFRIHAAFYYKLKSDTFVFIPSKASVAFQVKQIHIYRTSKLHFFPNGNDIWSPCTDL